MKPTITTRINLLPLYKNTKHLTTCFFSVGLTGTASRNRSSIPLSQPKKRIVDYVKSPDSHFMSFLLRWLVIFTCFIPLAWADVNTPLAIPPLTTHVTDLTSTLNNTQQLELENQLKTLEARKGSQLALLIIPTTHPETIEQYALRVVEKWKIGRSNVDDGVLLLIAKNDRTIRIEVGYGLEGALNDAVSKQIISNIITPRFQQNDFYGGIQAGIQSIIRVIDGEALPGTSVPNTRTAKSEPSNQWIIFAIFIGIFAGKILKTIVGIFPGALLSGILASIVVWLLGSALFMTLAAGLFSFFLTLTGGHRGFSNGWYSGGSLSGGSFDHFSGGGGGFGGGGASGKW